MNGLTARFTARNGLRSNAQRDWWHIDSDRSRPSSARNFIIENNFPGLVIRGPPVIPAERDQSSWSLS